MRDNVCLLNITGFTQSTAQPSSDVRIMSEDVQQVGALGLVLSPFPSLILNLKPELSSYLLMSSHIRFQM